MASRYYTQNQGGGNGQGLSSIFNNFANSWQNADRTSQARDQQDNANQDQINQNHKLQRMFTGITTLIIKEKNDV